MPFELVVSKVDNRKSNIVCQRFFKINHSDLSKAKTLDFIQLFSACVRMTEDAIADASAAFLSRNPFVIYSRNLASLSPRRGSRGDIVFIESEDGFYEGVDGHWEKITDDGALRLFAPLGNPWELSLELFYKYPKAERRLLLAGASIDVSKYPRHIVSKIDLTGKRKYWEQSRNLIYDMIRLICQGLSSR